MKRLLLAVILIIFLSTRIGVEGHLAGANNSSSSDAKLLASSVFSPRPQALMSLTAPATSLDALFLAPGAVLSMVPQTSSVTLGEVFDVDVMLDSADQQVSGVQAFIDFDPALLEVQDASPGRDGVQIEAGTMFPFVLVNKADNELGRIDFAAAKLGEPFPSGSFVVATIKFKALEVTPPEGAALDFSLEGDRETIVDLGGNPILDEAIGAIIAIRPALVETSLTVTSEVVQSGQQVIASVIFESAQNAKTIQFDLEFDSSVIRPASATAGDLPGGTEFESILNIEGVISVSIESPDSLEPGEVTLARVTFDVVGNAGDSTDLALANVKVSDATDRSIPYDLVKTSVSITEQTQPAPTSTATPTSAPSATPTPPATATPTPSITPAPTATAIATTILSTEATPQPSPTPLPTPTTSGEEESQTNLLIIIIGVLAGAIIIGSAAWFFLGRRRV